MHKGLLCNSTGGLKQNSLPWHIKGLDPCLDSSCNVHGERWHIGHTVGPVFYHTGQYLLQYPMYRRLGKWHLGVHAITVLHTARMIPGSNHSTV